VKGVAETTYHGEQTARMLEGIEEILLEEYPAVVLVCGDANYNLAGALAARKLGMVVGHVEAGLRSNDWRMPEEHNRVIIDHISEHLFAPTKEAKQNAIEDDVKGDIHVTGNTIVDAVHEHRDIAHEKSDILSELGLEEYFLVTAHREENVDDEANLTELVELLERVDETYDADIVFSIHPRTVERLAQFGLRNRLNAVESIQIVDPLGYIDFLQLQSNARTILTDSGGIQEEACILQISCVTLRENTERPETVEVGANIVAGTNPERVLDAIEEVQSRKRDWANPFGDGTAAEQILDVAVNEIE
jgi:UDP-N-acetylglucosamine 2-epimerase (non-hydrolysing)